MSNHCNSYIFALANIEFQQFVAGITQAYTHPWTDSWMQSKESYLKKGFGAKYYT